MKFLRGLIIFILMAVVSCSSLETIQAPDSSKQADPATTNQIQKIDSGTITGNPTKPGQNAVIQMGFDMELFPEGDVTCGMRMVVKNCVLPIKAARMGLMGMYMVNCIHPETGDVSVCSTDYYVQDGFVREKLFESDLSEDKIVSFVEQSEDSNDFSANFSGDFGGLQLSLKYIEFDLADSFANPLYKGLEKATFRYCLVNQSSISLSEMKSYCGNRHAQRGDMLIDLDLDGQFGFLDFHLGKWVERRMRTAGVIKTEPDLSYLSAIDTNPSFTNDSMSPLLQDDFTHLSFGFAQVLSVAEVDSAHIQVSFDASESLSLMIPKVDGRYKLKNSTLYFNFPQESVVFN